MRAWCKGKSKGKRQKAKSKSDSACETFSGRIFAFCFLPFAF
jgi:hypothetical protein